MDSITSLAIARQNPLFLFITTVVAALGGLLFGYDTGVISGVLILLKQTWPMSTFTQEIIVSSAVLGALLGAIGSGRLADRYGSHCLLLWVAVIFMAGTLVSSLAVNIPMLIAGRTLIGIAIGITSYLSPFFIAEMAPAEHRGALVLLNGIMITGGEALAFLMDYTMIPLQSWRGMLALGLVPALLLFAGMLILPPSPRWTVRQGDLKRAREILSRIRHPWQVDAELNEITQSSTLSGSEWKILFTSTWRPVLVMGLGLGILQQFSGINAVMYYGPVIFKAAGFHDASAQMLATFGVGLMNMAMTIVAICVVDKLGRRSLLLGGTAVATISMFMVSYLFSHGLQSVWLIFGFFLLFIAGYCLSVGSLFWLLIAEIYPLHLRGFAMSLATATQWAANFIVSISFLSILNHMGTVYTFGLYGMMCLASFAFCYYLIPETRGISLEKIESKLRKIA